MTPSALEAWVLRVVDQVARGEHAEDSRVELKRDWPSPASAARSIAGHANAARGASILWIVGLDESSGVYGAPVEELANWYGRVREYFDGVSPALYDLNVVVGDKTLVALHFDTDRAPFVVRNPTFGTPGGGAVEREVPWREGRSTCSARREHLIRLLVPSSKLPEVEMLSCSISTRLEQRAKASEVEWWYLRGTLYLTPVGNDVVIPFHRAAISVLDGPEKRIGPWERFRMFPPGRPGIPSLGVESRIDSATVVATSSEIIISGPGKVHFESTTTCPIDEILDRTTLDLRLVLGVVGAEMPLALAESLAPITPTKGQRRAWAAAKKV